MNINNNIYPYPVLSDYNTDYINSSFEVDYTIRDRGFQTKDLLAEFKLENVEIAQMIREGRLAYGLHVECPMTSYRKLLKLNDNETKITINIDTDKMRNKLEVSGFIVSNEEIGEYSNKDINHEIYGENYIIKNIEQGSIIAATLTQSVDIETDDNDFEQISSIINVGESTEDLMSVDMDGDIIIVKIPKEEYKLYVKLSGTDFSDIIMTSTILPSLVYILDMMKDGRGDTDLVWYKTIEKKLSIKDIDVMDINESHSGLELAQMILESPLERALNKIDQEIEREVL